MAVKKKTAGGIAAVSAAALALAVPFVTKWEGTRTLPYRDIVGVWTVCTGETRVEMRTYTKAECSAMLRKSLESDFGQAVLRCTPVLADRPKQLAAAISLTYNIGPANYCRSTAARRFNAGQFHAACEAFLPWNRAGGRVIQGLVNRRREERKLCLEGAAG